MTATRLSASDLSSSSQSPSYSSTPSRRDLLRLTGAGAGSAIALSLLAGCGSKSAGGSAGGSASATSGTQTITDMTGTQVEVPIAPAAYADGWYAHNEVIIMLAGAKGLKATHCDPKVCPNMSGAKSTFGDGFNLEELTTIDPAPQVIFDSDDKLRDKATEVGIPVVACKFSTYEEMKKSITMTSQVLGGDATKIAERYNAELGQVVKDVKAKTDGLSDEQRPMVMHGNSVYALNLDGTGTIIDEWIKTAGGKNAVTETTSSANAQFTMEQILAWDPDVIITGKAGEAEKILADPNWASIKAVQNQKVYVNPKGVFGWDRYGVEAILQVQWASALLHPELFPDLKIETKLKEFYKNYLSYELTEAEVALIMAAQEPQ